MAFAAKPLAAVLILVLCTFAWAGDASSRAWELEKKGDAPGARDLLLKAAQSASASLDDLTAYAQFLDRHGDPSARSAYTKALAAAHGAERTALAHRLTILDLLAGDRPAAVRDLGVYREAGGKDLALPTDAAPAEEKKATFLVPGPFRSFARMAALSPDLDLADFVPALARNIVTNGYQAANSNEALEQTEYLKLVIRYLSQARELDKLAGPDKIIKIETCDSTQTGELLRVLGYRMRGACGSDVVLETVNATRAFLTIDSGFPLAGLEQSLRTNRPFTYDFKPTEVPVLYGADYWLAARDKPTGDFLDFFLSDPSTCRLYLGMSKLDPATADQFRKTVAVQKIRAYSHVLDFYGGMFELRNGKALTPGDARSEKAWAELVGVGPDKGADFLQHLLAKDDGWLASYFDALMRIEGPVQAYLCEPDRLKRFYSAIKGRITSPGPARPVFRANTDMMLLTTRLGLDASGRPYLPGGVEVWRDLFIHHPHGKYDGKLTKSAAGWKDSDDVLEALFALTRKSVENEPLKIFMALTDIDRNRSTHLDAQTADSLAREYRDFGSQYSIFSETPTVSNATIGQFLAVAGSANQLHDQMARADAAGSLQALAGLWQIFCRQGSIAPGEADSALAGLVNAFAKAKDEREIFDASRAGVKILMGATHAPQGASAQDWIVDLLAGAAKPGESDVQTQMVQDMIRVFEAQRLVSLTTIFDLVDNLEGVSRGEKTNPALIAKAAARIGEINLPRGSLSTVEKNALAFGYWSEKHIEAQRKLNLRAIIDHAATDPKRLQDVRGLLEPFLRDTLVGLNYAHYAPPGAQILLTNPLFVRSHDFVGLQGNTSAWRATEVQGSGWPSSAGGKLVGSLSGLPYALAEAEQNFLIPTREQALIWGDLVPQILVGATVPRWWRVTPTQLHWVALHMNLAEAELAEAMLNPDRKEGVLESLRHHAAPWRVWKIDRDLQRGNLAQAREEIMPAEMFLLAEDIVAARHTESNPIVAEVRRISSESPEEISAAAISRAFGTPKPTLAHSYMPQLLNLRTFPALMGYSSRILAESWESSVLYYAALADELYLPPSQLNVLIPAWTQQTVEHIFATHLEDWPALLRSLRLVGEDARQKSRQQVTAAAGGQ